MARKRAKRSAMPPLTTSFRRTTPSTCRALGHGQRRRARVGDAVARSPRARPAPVRPCAFTQALTASTAPLRILPAVEIAAAHARQRRERDELRAQLVRRRGRAGRTSSWPARRWTAPPGVSSARLASWAASASASSRTPSTGMNSVAMRLPSVIVPVLSSSRTSTSPAASMARPLMAMTFLRIRRSMPAMPMAESKPPIVVGIRQTSSATMTVADSRDRPVERQRHQRHAGEQEHQRQPDQQDVERDLVRRLLARRPFDERDHAIEERLARVRRDAHDDAIGQHLGAAGHRRAVAAALANDRRRLAGDGRLVDRGHAFDDLAVAGDELAGLDDDAVAGAQGGRAHDLGQPVAQAARAGLGAHAAQRIRLRLAAPLRHRLGEVGEQHREPEPDRDRWR